MTKSEIVVAVFLSRPSPKQEADIRIELAYFLGQQLLTLDEWDKTVYDSIGSAISKNMSGIKGELSMPQVIRDIDTVLKRIS